MSSMTASIRSPFTHWYCRWAKRAADMALAAMLLLTIFPLAYAIVAIVVKTTAPGPVMTTEDVRTLNLATMHHERHSLWRFRIKPNRLVRATHLDRWPRLLNILVGTTSFVVPPTSPAATYRYLTTWLPAKDGKCGL